MRVEDTAWYHISSVNANIYYSKPAQTRTSFGWRTCILHHQEQGPYERVCSHVSIYCTFVCWKKYYYWISNTAHIPPIGEGVFICLFSSQVSIRTTSYQWWTCHSGDSHASLLRVSMSGGAAIRSRMTAASEKAARPFPSRLLMKNENTPKSSLCNQRTGQKESTESHVNKVLHVEKGLSGYLEPPKVNPSHRDTCLCDTRPSRRLMRCGWTFSFDEMTANCYSEADCIMIKTIKVVFTRWRHLRMCRQRRGRSGCTSFVSSLSDRLADSWVCVSKILPQISLPWKGGRHSLRLDSATGGIL